MHFAAKCNDLLQLPKKNTKSDVYPDRIGP